MKRAALPGTVIAALLAVTGCGGSGGPASYLATGASSADFIQWQATSSGHLEGTLTDDRMSGTAPGETLSVNRWPFTGTINGNSVTLTFNDILTQVHVYATCTAAPSRSRSPRPTARSSRAP
ncbi:MAG TPA: hypothetical protein DHU96_22335 [Actinobacteria bacterium]|nr:hypothetical protein [Actinomycetota bacterium]